MKGHFYDFIIMGDSLAGLAVAVMMARKGADIQVLIPEKSKPISYMKKSFSHSPLCLNGIEHGTWFRKFCAKSVIMTKPPNRIDPCFQVLLPDARIDLKNGFKEYLDELKYEIPDSCETMSSFLNYAKNINRELERFLSKNLLVKHNGFWAKQGLNKKLKKSNLPSFLRNHDIITTMKWIRENPDLEQFTMANHLLFSNTVNPSLNPYTLSWNLQVPDEDPYPELCCIENFKEVIIDQIKHFLGEVKYIDEVPNIKTSGSLIKQIELNDNDVVKGKHFILNGYNKIFADKIQQFSINLPFIRYKRLNYYFEIDRTGIPEGMGRHLAYFNDLGVESTPITIINVEMSKDSSSKKFTNALFVSAFARNGENIDFDKYLEIGENVYRELKNIIPFFDQHYVFSCPDYSEKKKRKLPEREYFEAQLESEYNNIYEIQGRGISDILKVAIETKFKNMFFMGNSILPGLGLAGEIYAAYKFVEQVEKS
ncbi:MAG: hypothetical protein ABIA04_12980 [Pseudomonadota bacterium]